MSGAAAMQRRKTLMILGTVASVAVLLGALSFLPPAQDLPRAEVGQRVLPAFGSKADLVNLVMVTTGEESYHLVRNPDGWVLAEKGSYPVRPERIEDLKIALANVAYAESMTRDERKFDRIGLGDPTRGGTGALLEVGDGSGTNFAKLIVGYRDGRSYVRAPDDLQAWAVSGLFPPLQRASAWLDLNVAPVKAEDIAGVDVRPAAGPAYRLVPRPEGGFGLAPPHSYRPLVAAFAPTMSAEALTRLAPSDVAPAGEIAVGAPVAEHITRLKSGAVIVVRSWKAKDRFWVTVSAATGEGAPQPAVDQAMAINARALPWAFGLTELEWGGFGTPLSAIAD